MPAPHFSRRTFLMAAAAAAGSLPLRSLAGESELRFVVLSDTHLGRPGDEARLERLIPLLAREQPAFILHAGDLVHETVAVGAQVKIAQRLLARMPAKFLLAPGNHDIGISRKPELVAAWRALFGPTEATLRYAGWRAVGFNSMALTIACGDRKQRDAVLDFLERQLDDAAKAGERVVLLHHLPEVIVPYHQQLQAPWADDAIRRYEAMLTRAPPALRVAGHWHLGVRVPSVAGNLVVCPPVSSLGNAPSGYLRCVAGAEGAVHVEQVIVEAGTRELPAAVRLFALPMGEPPKE